jgi:uncharacterized delta-60 repeat protein
LLRKTTLVFLILSLISALTTALRPGDLDPTFGTEGKVKTSFVGGVDMGGAVVQPDGKIVVAGRVGGTDPHIIVRYTSDGGLDPTFGSSNGKQISPFIVLARAVAVQPDGRIIVGGVGQGICLFLSQCSG